MKTNFFFDNPGWALRIFGNKGIRLKDVTFWFDIKSIDKASVELLNLYIRSQEPGSGFAIRLYDSSNESNWTKLCWRFFLVDYYKRQSEKFTNYLNGRIFSKFWIEKNIWMFFSMIGKIDLARDFLEARLRGQGAALIERYNFFEGRSACVFANLSNSGTQAALCLALESTAENKCHYLVPTWDYLTTKGPILGRLDSIFLWNNDQVDELNRYHRYSDFKKIVVGSMNFSGYLDGAYKFLSNENEVADSETRCEQNSFDILFLGSTKSIDPGETMLVEEIARILAKNDRVTNFYYKPHPTRYTEVFRNLSWKSLIQGSGLVKFKPTFSIVSKLIEELDRNTLVLGVNSSSMWEFSVSGFPVRTIASLSNGYTTIHEQYLYRVFGEPLHVEELEQLTISESEFLRVADRVYRFIFNCSVREMDWKHPLSKIRQIPGVVGVQAPTVN